MLPDATIPGSLAGLLLAFRSCFTAPTFNTFNAMTVGLIAQTRRRTVCGMLLGVGLERLWHHARAHRFFATARWCADELGLTMLDLIVNRLLPAGSAITVVIDDTLFKRAGRKVFGVFWHHDGAATGPKPIGFAQLLGGRRNRRAVAVADPAGMPAGARTIVASPAHRQARPRQGDGRTGRRPPPRPVHPRRR
jgi:hypothetical protein